MKLIAIDSIYELDAIQRKFPSYSKYPLLLLSSRFSSYQLSKFKTRGYMFFDDGISREEAIDAEIQKETFIWNWFRNNSRDDLSILDECSLGLAFSSSIEILATTIWRYHLGLEKILKDTSEIICLSTTEKIFLIILKDLAEKDRLEVSIIEGRDNFQGDRRNFHDDPNGRLRHHESSFTKSSYRETLLSSLVRIFPRTNLSAEKILFLSAGKLNDYLSSATIRFRKRGHNLVLPTSLTGLIHLREHFHPTRIFVGNESSDAITATIDRLEGNLRAQEYAIDSEVTISCLQEFIFPFFYSALCFFRNVKRELRRLNVKVVIVGADAHELAVIPTLAAKNLGITTILTNHGLTGWGYDKFKHGPDAIFDNVLAAGSLDVNNATRSGLSEKDCPIASFPYFAKFLPVKRMSNDSELKNAAVLPLDYANQSVGEKLREHCTYLKDIQSSLEGLNINILCVKFRHSHCKEWVNSDIISRDLKKPIPFIANERPLSDVIQDADLLIGPPSTALIETLLQGKAYFTYLNNDYPQYSRSCLTALYDMIYVAHTTDELIDNIRKRKIFKDGYTVNDLIRMDGFDTPDDLYSYFEDAIDDLLKTKSTVD